MEQKKGSAERTAGEAGWHASRYNLMAKVPGSDNVAIANLFKGTCAEYNLIEVYLLSMVEQLSERHPVIERFAKRGVVCNFDERAALETYAMGHREIVVYLREGSRKVELDTIAVDIVNANRETLRTEFDDQDEFEAHAREAVGESDLVLESPKVLPHLYAFSTCPYQTGNSHTVVYAIEKGGT